MKLLLLSCCAAMLLDHFFLQIPTEAHYLLNKNHSHNTNAARTYDGSQLFPVEIWKNILRYCSPGALWNFGLTSKFFGSLVRDNTDGLKSAFLNFEGLWEVIYASDLTIKPWMLPYFQSYTDGWRWKARPEQEMEEDEALQKYLLGAIVSRVEDPSLLFKLFQDRNAPFPECILPAQISANLWSGALTLSPLVGYSVGQEFAFWVPSNSKAFLFDTVSINLICGIALQDVFAHIFDNALLAQYLIPEWKGQRQMTRIERDMIKYLARNVFAIISHQVSMLKVAIYFLTGQHDRNSSVLMKKFYTFFEDLGFNVDELTFNLPDDTVEFNQVAYSNFDIGRILFAAHLWGLDIWQLALNYNNGAEVRNRYVAAILKTPLQKIPDLAATPMDVMLTVMMPLSYPVKCVVRNGKVFLKREASPVSSCDRPRKKLKAETEVHPSLSIVKTTYVGRD